VFMRRDDLLEESARREGRRAVAEEWPPEVDVYEHPEGYLLTFALPGVVAEHIDVQVAGTVLTVQGKREFPVPENAVPRRIELPRGRFHRQVRLPASADLSSIRTQLMHGLLLVHVTKPPPTRVRVQARG
jgi:HSP20 family protein